MGQPCPALASSSSVNEGFGVTSQVTGGTLKNKGAPGPALHSQVGTGPSQTLDAGMGWGLKDDGGRRCSCMEPTPRNIPELGKAMGVSALSRGREAALPSVGALHNHYLRNTWHGENGVALSGPSCSSLGWGAQGLLVASASSPSPGVRSTLHCVPALGMAQDSTWLAHVSW